jgi:hypothetical protein
MVLAITGGNQSENITTALDAADGRSRPGSVGEASRDVLALVH